MVMKPTKSISLKIRRVIFVTTAVATVLASISYVVFGYVTAKQSLVDRIYTLADFVAINSTAALSFESARTAEQLLHSLHVDPSIDRAILYTANRQLLASFEGLNIPPVNTAQPMPVNLIEILEGAEKSHLFDDNKLTLTQSVLLENEIIGAMYFEANLQSLNEAVEQNVVTSIILLMLILA